MDFCAGIESNYYFLSNKDATTKVIFIGKGKTDSKKIYLVDVGLRHCNISLSKLNRVLFTPFGRCDKLAPNDDVQAPFIMINMNCNNVEIIYILPFRKHVIPLNTM